MEVWKGWVNNSIAYCLSSDNLKDLDDSIGVVSFSDVDRNGFVDLVFPINNPSQVPTISVVFNQIKVEIDWTYDYCKERRPDSQKLVKIFPDNIFATGVDDLNSQIFIKLLDDNTKSLYTNSDLKVLPLVRVGNY